MARLKATSGPRGRGNILRQVRDKLDWRKTQQPAIPTKIERREKPFVYMRPRPKNPLPAREAKRRTQFKTKLLARYDTDEYNRRQNLTNYQHQTHIGSIGTEGFRNQTTVKGIPYDRNRSPYSYYQGKRRQYAAQFERPFSQNYRDHYLRGGDQGPFRGRRMLYTFIKRQPVVKLVSGN